MRTATFTLRSGAKLYLNAAPWKEVVSLFSEVKKIHVMNPGSSNTGDLIVTSDAVRNCVWTLMTWATYDNIKMHPDFFDDEKYGEKAQSDYLEIVERIIEFQLAPFFLKSSSTSTATAPPTQNPG